MAGEEWRATAEVMRSPLEHFVTARTQAVRAFRALGQAEVAANVELRCDYFNLTATLGQQFSDTSGLVKADLIVDKYIRPWLRIFFSLEHLPGVGDMGQVCSRHGC